MLLKYIDFASLYVNADMKRKQVNDTFIQLHRESLVEILEDRL